jgi:hypothetical protein
MAGKRKTVAPAEPALSWGQRLERLGRSLLTRLVLPVVIPVVLISVGLFGLYRLQGTLREGAGPVLVPLADIQCEAPPGISREDFLQDVAFLADLPARVDLLDSERLAAAFARHPWVESVERITALPERRPQVVLVFRVPVLLVRYREGRGTVDRRGVLLPESAPAEGLPSTESEVPPRRGAVWLDPRVKACAAVAGFLHGHQDRLRLVRLSCEQRGVLLSTVWGETIIWGSPPGFERADEPAADRKVARLLQRSIASGTDLDLRIAPAP